MLDWNLRYLILNDDVDELHTMKSYTKIEEKTSPRDTAMTDIKAVGLISRH